MLLSRWHSPALHRARQNHASFGCTALSGTEPICGPGRLTLQPQESCPTGAPYSILEPDHTEWTMERTADYKRIIDRVIDPKAPYTAQTTIYSKAHTAVTKVMDSQPYAVRVSPLAPPDHSIRMAILEEIGSLDGSVATILHSEKRTIEGCACTVDVMPFLPGEVLDRFPSPEETLGILETMHALHQGLKKASPSFQESGLPCLSDVLHGLLAASGPGTMRSRAEALLEDERFMQLLASDERCLLYGDPWPSNFLVEQRDDSIAVRVVDIDPIFIGPAILQPALVFSAYFVASSILFQKGEGRPDLDALIRAWPETINRGDTVKMMRVYPILLSLVKLAEGAAGSTDLLDANLRLLEQCLEVVDSYE